MLTSHHSGKSPDLPPARLLIADDHAVVRAGTRRLLEAEPGLVVACEAADGDAAYAAVCGGLEVDAAVVDLSMPGRSGLDLLRRLATRRPELALLVFTMHVSPALVRQAFQAGAWAYVSKSSAPEEMVVLLRQVLAGERGVCSSDVAALAPVQARPGGAAALTPREFDVLRLWVEGADTEAIARRLFLSPKTVANVASTLRAKLGATSAVELLRRAREYGLAAE
jgi:DNA-binding NarL/FixJ family response regulator